MSFGSGGRICCCLPPAEAIPCDKKSGESKISTFLGCEKSGNPWESPGGINSSAGMFFSPKFWFRFSGESRKFQNVLPAFLVGIPQANLGILICIEFGGF